jgi:hypothetical protein
MRAKALRNLVVLTAASGAAWWATGASAITDFGHGKPITFQDLAGKKFCWSTGYSVVYGANGLETNNKNDHHPAWSVPEPGALKYWGNHFTQVEVLPDGRLHFYKYCLVCSEHDHDNWATPCN